MGLPPFLKPPEEFSAWARRYNVPWASLVFLTVALANMLIVGFTWTNVLLVVGLATITGLRYLRMRRGSLEDARLKAAATAKLRKPLRRADLPVRVEQSLLDEEKVIVETRLHPVVLIKWVALAFVTTIAVPALIYAVNHSDKLAPRATFLTLALLVLALAVYAVDVFQFVDWHRSRLYVTNNRILFMHGAITMRLAETQIKKLTDKESIERMFPLMLARLRIIYLPYGQLDIETAGQKQWISVLLHVPNVKMTGRIISEFASGGATVGDDDGF